MTAYVVRRVLSAVLLLLSISLVTYLVFYTIPTNPACVVVDCGPGNHTTPEQLHAAEHLIGVDQPVLVQYGHFLWRLVSRGSLGRSFTGNESVTAIIGQTLPVTASLVLGGAVLLLLLAVPLAIVAARRPRSPVDRGLLAAAIVGIAVHPFVLAIGLRSIFARHLGIAPRGGYCTLLPSDGCSGPASWAYHMYLPWLTFALFFLPLYMRMIRARVLETMGEQFVIAARAKGVPESRLVVSHVLRNTMGPVLAMVAVDLGTAITAAIYVETIFGLPGLGHEAVEALAGAGGYDLPVVVGIVLTIAVGVTLLNTAADLAIAGLDPRVRLGAGKGLLRLPRPVARVARRVPPRVAWAGAAAVVAALGGLLAWNATRSSGANAGAAPASLLSGPVQTLPAGWSETKPLEDGQMVFRVRAIEVGRRGWLVRGSVENRSRTAYTIAFGRNAGATAGFSVLEPATLGLRVLPATAFRPALPPVLAPGGRWSGAFAGTSAIPHGKFLYVGFGYFLPARPADESSTPLLARDGFNWLTTHTFRVSR
ncbi:MAG TPA: ABC transporter permease [Gaiellaceae bacterium]|nr:ABC transporter permease [Gaiellaceae bacterium]